MLVNSFDTKYSKTANKYELLDDNFTSLFSKDKKFNRIFTSVLENQELNSSSSILLRSDITGQVINTILSHDFKKKHYLYYMGDVFKKDIINSQIKQCRQHGVEIINNSKYESFKEVIKTLDKILSRFLKQDFIYIFTDPIIKNQSKYLLKAKPNKNDINKFLNIFKKLSKSRYALNLEENFFSKDYHQDIFFYVYSTRTKKVLAQGGGYHYQKNQKVINGLGFSYDVDSLAELI